MYLHIPSIPCYLQNTDVMNEIPAGLSCSAASLKNACKYNEQSMIGKKGFKLIERPV